MDNKVTRIFSILIFTLAIAIQTTTAQPLSIEWGKEQPYHKKGETKSIEIIKYEKPYVFYLVSTSALSGAKEFIVKHNWNTGENIEFDIEVKHKLGERVSSSAEIVEGNLEIRSYIYALKRSHQTQVQKLILDTANLEIKKDRETVEPDSTNDRFEIPEFVLENYDPNFGKYKTDKSGNYYFGIRKFKNKKDKSKFRNSIISLAYYPIDTKTPVQLELKLPENLYISYYKIALNDKEEIICTGVYSKKDLKSAYGCFSYVIAPKLSKIISSNIKEFPTSLLSKGLDEKEATEIAKKTAKNKEFDNEYFYKCSDIHFNKDGSFTMSVEKSRIEIITRNNLTTIHYYFDDIYVLSFKPDGTVKWMQKLVKNTHATDADILASHYHLKYDDNDNVYFIFNQSQTKKPLYLSKESKTICIKYDINGNEKYSEINTNGAEPKYLCPIFFEDAGPDSVIIVQHNYDVAIQRTGSSKNTIKFGILKLK